MGYKVKSLNIGKPQKYTINNRELYTAFVKNPTEDSILLTQTGFMGDGQADLKNHGGADKALLMYNSNHYSFWEKHYNQAFDVPAFGENITIEGLSEEEVYIGNKYSLGEAVIQVSQPRQPCYKIAEINQLKDIVAVVTETGFTGYYFRVLQEGMVSPSDTFELIEEDKNKVSVTYIHQTLFFEKDDFERLERILKVDTIASSLRRSINKRLEKLKASS